MDPVMTEPDGRITFSIELDAFSPFPVTVTDFLVKARSYSAVWVARHVG